MDLQFSVLETVTTEAMSIIFLEIASSSLTVHLVAPKGSTNETTLSFFSVVSNWKRFSLKFLGHTFSLDISWAETHSISGLQRKL